MDEKLRKLVSRHCPATEKAFFGRKYLVPTYRQTDYENLDFTNALELDRLVRYALGESDVGNQRNLLGLASTLGTLAYDRQTLFLEADLGSALNRTQGRTISRSVSFACAGPVSELSCPAISYQSKKESG
jgi:hypothetical protein